MKAYAMIDHLVREYYRCFNERRIAAAGTLFAPDAVVEMPPFVERAHGSDAYTRFADTWLCGFPDAQFTIEQVQQRNETMCEVDLIATGTHAGPLDLGAFGLLRPSGVRLTLRLRELLDVRDGRITYASLSFDLNGLMRQLNRIDYEHLLRSLAAIRQLADELAHAHADSEQQCDVTERLGHALDAARLIIRPQFRR
jgi:predicted ester cyclase